ncbi:viroplasmin family protein [Paenisporosarcina indica]|uniref:ribonuclease H1 domain-containing protein n=1 Tax=Paenisporosarcina indica TaxID=650093 RepID=UPI0009501926|nr:ribonuclease H family protein [Paenisporosarcina indica]
MEKFYAVKSGRKAGIFTTWAECEQQVKGFSGARYKSFATKGEAEEFLKGNESSSKTIGKDELHIYVDGSYSKKLKKAGFGCVFVLKEIAVHTVAKEAPIDKDEDLWNVSAEIAGVLCAVEWAIKNKYPIVNIFYDYEGLEKWYSGEWKANKKTTKNYVSKLNQLKKEISINFVKVKAHSGDTFNELADQLAKSAIYNVETENNDRKSVISEILTNAEADKLSLTDFYKIIGEIDEDKVKIKYKDLIINDNAIIKIAKYFWKKEKRKISDLQIEAYFDLSTFILELNLSEKQSDYTLNKKIIIEGE